MKLLICFGTRPEYIKVKSLINHISCKTCFTGQHTNLINNDIKFDHILKIDDDLSRDNRLNNIMCNILQHSHIFEEIDHVLVQGDTTSALAIALSAFNHKINVIHLEAGLRTNTIADPFPEESNRQLISRIATIHLCPTAFNKQNLERENVGGKIFVVGNTGLDNITKDGCEYGNKVLITMHRRDNIGTMNEWFVALEKIATKYDTLEFVLPLHPNPLIQQWKYLCNKIRIIPPLDHADLIEYVKKCKFVISDSGGLQEECAFLNKKIIVCRKSTERPESVGIHSVMCLAPENLEKIVQEMNEHYLIDDVCPYGDGKSWTKIKDILC